MITFRIDLSLCDTWKDSWSLLLPAQALTLTASPHLNVGLWLTVDQFRPANEAWKERERTAGIHTLITIHTNTQKVFFPFKPESVSSGPQGRLIRSIITAQRNAFVRWIINTYPRSLHQQLKYTYSQSRFSSGQEILSYWCKGTTQVPPVLQLDIKATFLFDKLTPAVWHSSHICTQGLSFSTSLLSTTKAL